jgi:hypothetical protein
MIKWNRLHHYWQAMPIWQWIALAVSVAAAIWLIFRIRAYFRENAEDSDQTLEMLTQFRDLHQEGGLSDDEFRLIRSRLAHTAQEALVAGKAKSSAISADLELLNSRGDMRVNSSDSTAINTTDDDETSSRKMDEETD